MPDELSNQVTAIPAGTPEAIPQAIQLRLLPAPQPLTHRLGKEFFGALPRTPGVYRFHDSTNRIIYVGKARDLRQRLSSYRSTTHASRKTKRMLAFAETVSFEECASEAAAFLRENELLRTLRPRFNRMNVYPPAYAFIVLWATETTLHLELRRGNVEVNQAGAKIHGAFKAGGAYTFAALLRLLHAGSHGRFDSLTLPRQLLAERPPQSWDVLSSDALGLMDKVGMFLRAEPAPFAA